MAHEIETRDGIASMMYAGKKPWHGLGQAVESEVTAAAAIKLANMDWELEKRPIFIKGTAVVDGIPVIGREIPEKMAVVRTCDSTILGVVSDSYEIIQNSECFDFMDALIGSGQAVYHTAGSLFGGRRVFLTVKLPGNAMVGSDKIEKYILLTSSHDGSLALNVRWTPIRVVCNNTMNAALARNVQAGFSIRHTKSYKAKVAEARKVLDLSDHYYKVMETEFNKLLDAKFTDGDMISLNEKLFPSKTNDDGTEHVPTATKNTREKVLTLFHNGIGVKPVANTRWAAFNAVTEYVDHHRGVMVYNGKNEQEVKMDSAIYGSGSRMKQTAFDLLKV